MTRIVVDSNVYVSALVFGGVPQKVLDLIETYADLILCISRPIMDEVAEVLGRKFDWTKAELQGFLPPLWQRCIVVVPTVAVKICNDPDDNRILECAQTAAAHFIVTGDDDLLRLGIFGTARIVTPRAFVDAHGKS
jgi:putative PIN family toxin of toxin-antitoxin system